ncbi:LD-carboxypeptidase [Vulgatibacter sp.]|uniref:S66 peptidase family protein n=1 Tax=Vulgatibacter sp. TaxID=1971226 RepID=UPI0035689C03
MVAPSGPFPADRYERGRAVLEARGFRVKEFLPSAPHRYLAGTDEERLAGLHAAFADPEVRAVFAARGGYGAMRLLPGLDVAAIAASRKALVGFSDVTALHLALQQAGARSVHGPVVTRLGEEPPEALDRLFALLAGEAPAPLQGRTLVPGSARGRLLGGNLSVLTRLIGTRWMPSLAGCLLLVEDVGERPYRLDRIWSHLELTGLLDGVAGFVLGDFTGCDDASVDAQTLMAELVAAAGKPTLAGFPIGHGDVHLAVPLGTAARIENGTLHFDEGLQDEGRS